jgi:hypothetical protein
MDNELVGSYDDLSAHNNFSLEGTNITLMDMLETVDGIIQDAAQGENPELVMNAARSLLGMSKVSGIALAKLLHGMRSIWPQLKVEDVDDKTFVREQIGVEPITLKRYIQTWDMFAGDYVPKDLAQRIMQRPMKDLIAISACVAHGFEPNKAQWRELASATNNAEVREILRKIKGTPPKKNSVTIMLDKDGTLHVMNGKGKHFIGNLVLDDKDPLVAKAVARIISHSGIVER